MQAQDHEATWQFRGYGEARASAYAGADADPYELDVVVRPRLKLTWPEGGSVVLEPEVRYAIGRNQDLFDDWEDTVGIERLYGEFDFSRADVVLGKQAVNWGSALVFNPTDAFDDVFLRDPWAENSGHSALRVTVPLSPTREVMTMLASDDRFEEGLLAARGRATFGTTDIALSAARDPFRGADLLGLDLKGEATVGLWLEAAWARPWDDRDPFLRTVAGVDYTFGARNGLYLAAQYYRDESGASREQDYDLGAWLRGERSTLGRDYATLTGRLSWSEVLTVSTLTIANLNDGSLLCTTWADYTRLTDFTISVGGTFLLGDDGELNPPPALDPTGLLPDAIAFVRVRYHF